MRKKSRVIAIFFSMVPGAGHMYVGLQKQGLEFMCLFFSLIFFGNSLNMDAFMFLIPIVWCYSFFDILNKTSLEEEVLDEDIMIFSWLTKNSGIGKAKTKFIGYAFVIFGVLILAENIILPMFSYRYRNYFETGIISLLFILGGIKLLMGGKAEDKEDRK